MGWIIAAAIVLFFALLLAGKAAVFLDYNGELSLKIKYLCFTVIKIPKKIKKPKKSKSSKKKAKKKDKKAEAVKDDSGVSEKKNDKKTESSATNSKKRSDKKTGKEKNDEKKKFDLKNLTFEDKIELLKLALSGVGKPLKKLFKSIELSHVSIGIVCGGDDAAKTAIKFGAINIAAGNVLGLLDSFFTLKPLDDMNITVDFQSEQTLYDIYFEVRMSLFAGVAAVFRLLAAYLKLVKAYKQKQEDKPIK